MKTIGFFRLLEVGLYLYLSPCLYELEMCHNQCFPSLLPFVKHRASFGVLVWPIFYEIQV